MYRACIGNPRVYTGNLRAMHRGSVESPKETYMGSMGMLQGIYRKCTSYRILSGILRKSGQGPAGDLAFIEKLRGGGWGVTVLRAARKCPGVGWGV
jgi:hypothetical protein